MKVLNHYDVSCVSGGYTPVESIVLGSAITLVADIAITAPLEHMGWLDKYLDKHVISHFTKMLGLLGAYYLGVSAK